MILQNNIDGSRSSEVNLGITTIKRLMEKEMNHKHLQNRSPSQEFQFIISNFESEVQNRKKFREQNNDSKEIFNAVDSLTTIASMDNQKPESIDSTERTSANFDLAAFLIEFYGYSDKCQTIDVDSNDILDLCLSLKTLCEKLQCHHDPPHVMLDQKDSVNRTLTGVSKDGVSKNSINEKRSDKKMHVESNELIDAFKILNSKRELLLKLLQDSDSPLFKYAHETRNTEVAKYSKLESDNNTEKVQLLHKENGSSKKYEETDSVEMSHKRSRTFFFWKKHKTKGTKPSGGNQNSQPLNRIVVLKPIPERKHRPPITVLSCSSTSSKHSQGHEEDGKRVTSHFFSPNEIKRRLKHAFLEKKTELNMISRGSVLHKIPIGCKYSVETSNQFGNGTVRTRSARRSSCANEKSTDTLTIVKKKDKKPNADNFELRIRCDCGSPKPGYLECEEARNHIAKRRSTGDQINHLPTVQVSKSSGKILSLPDCNLPRPTVENKKEIRTLIMETEHSSVEHLAPKGTKSIVSSLKESLEVSSGSEIKENSQLMMLDLKKQLIDGHIEEESDVQEGLNQGGSIDLNKPKVDISISPPYQLEVLVESSNQELDNACNRFKEDYSILESDSSEVKSQSAIQPDSSSSPIIKKLFTVDHTTEVSGRIIVSEDITSRGRDVVHEKFQMQPQLNFQYNDNTSADFMLSDTENDTIRSTDENQARLEYVEAVLQAAGLTATNGFSERWLLGDKLLDPSLFDEVRTSCCPVVKDPQLLFDCISDVLVEIHERYFKHGLHRYFTNSSIHPVLSSEKLMKEVAMGVTRHEKMLLPKTVDEMIQKDLQSEAWIHFQLETESIAIDVCDPILDDMVEEAVFDLWF